MADTERRASAWPSSRSSGCGSRSTTSAPATPRFGTWPGFPIDVLKIDRSFVAEIGSDDRQAGDRPLDHRPRPGPELDVIAEGIERPEQERKLIELGCRLGQGFHLARPGRLEICDPDDSGDDGSPRRPAFATET